MKTDSKPKSTYKAVPLTVSDRRVRTLSATLPAGAVAITPTGLKPKVLPSAPVYARHQLPDDAVVPSVVSGAECRPWVRYLAGTV